VAFVVIIPARLASTRLPRKPLADVDGLPMVVRVAQAAGGSGARRVVVAADSGEIVDACTKHDVESILTRTEHPTGTDRLAEAVELLGLPRETIVVNVQGDEPLMPSAIVRRVAEELAARPECDIATACHPLGDAAEFFNPNVVKVVIDGRGRALYFSRAPIPWSRDAFAATHDRLPAGLPARRHIGLYAYRTDFLLRFPRLPRVAIEEHESLEQLRALAHGFGIAVIELSEPLPPGVDTPEDLERVRTLLRRGR
jgi:3-deoxy-manno-octulosonate cytidylyltransferase (CMP-KDO synthetase)